MRKIAHACQEYNIGKLFISSILPCTRTFANIAKINEVLKNVFFMYFEFIEHKQIIA